MDLCQYKTEDTICQDTVEKFAVGMALDMIDSAPQLEIVVVLVPKY